MGFSFKKMIGGAANFLSGGSTGDKIGGYRDDSGPPPPGNSPAEIVGTPEWLNFNLQNDPFMKQLMDQTREKFPIEAPTLGTDLTQQMMGVGQAQANQAAQGVSNSLAGRGGGIGSSLAIGAQARAGAATQGVAQGMQGDLQQFSQEIGRFQAQHDVYQAQRNDLLNALTFKYNMLNQVMGGFLGQQQAHLGFNAAKESADATRSAGMWQAAGSAVPDFK